MNKPVDKQNPAAEATSRMAEFERSLAELEALVERMEGGELTLDESLQSFERGISLFRYCQGTLEQAQLRVRTLLDPENPDTAQALED